VSEDIINMVIKVLKHGGLVVFPSDTVYGLLVDATNNAAVSKLIEFKNRPPGKPISVFVCDLTMSDKIVRIGNRQRQIIKTLLPGPFTLILNSKGKVSPLLESESKTLGIRLPDYDPVLRLVSNFGRPITATSANLSGRSPHYSVGSLLKGLPKNKQRLIDLVVDGGKLPRNKPSTIIDLVAPKIKILRQGEIVFRNKKNYLTKTSGQTRKLGAFILGRYLNEAKKKPLIFIIEGEMGVGKTILVKGMGDYFDIKNIISPSYVISYEYDVKDDLIRKLIHFDLYNLQEEGELKDLGIENCLKKHNLLCFEWGEKIGTLCKVLKGKGKIVYIKMKYLGEKEREITITD